jgi:hypothetical protein
VLIVTVVGGAARPGYDHGSQFISELGERGAADGFRVSWFGFLPAGVLAVAFGAVAARALWTERQLALGVGIAAVGMGAAYVISAFARCEAGCPSSGDVAQTIHNLLGGALGYVGAVVGMGLFALRARRLPAWRTQGRIALPLALVVLVLSSMVEHGAVADLRGAIQRACEALIWVWFLLVASRLSQVGATPIDGLPD